MYRERPSRLGGAVLWSRDPAPGGGRVLPDGCMDLLWNEGRLLVAGPDTHAYVTGGSGDGEDTGGRWAGVRFFPGSAPLYLGVPAVEVRDRRVALDDLVGAGRARRLAALVDSAADPVRGLEDAALRLADEAPPADPWPRLLVEALDQGHTVAAAADGLGLGARQLHRRSLIAFGYGPKTLARVLRLRRALDLARAGVPAAETAARAGFADQAHLARDVRALTGVPLTRLLAPAQRAPSQRAPSQRASGQGPSGQEVSDQVAPGQGVSDQVAPGQGVSDQVASDRGASDTAQALSGANRSTPLPSGSCTTA